MKQSNVTRVELASGQRAVAYSLLASFPLLVLCLSPLSCAQVRPVRTTAHQNYLSEEEYPMDELPPFAIGPHYVVSRDAAAFVGANAEALRGVGTLEDVSLALWLLALQIHPTHVGHFSNARVFGCDYHAENANHKGGGGGGGGGGEAGSAGGATAAGAEAGAGEQGGGELPGDWIVSLADVTPAGLLMLHRNVKDRFVLNHNNNGTSGWSSSSSRSLSPLPVRGFCSGYRSRWTKEPWRHATSGHGHTQRPAESSSSSSSSDSDSSNGQLNRVKFKPLLRG